MSSLARPPAELIRTDRPDWQDAVIAALLDGDNVFVVDPASGRRCLVPGGRIAGPVWRHARRYLREAGIAAPRRW